MTFQKNCTLVTGEHIIVSAHHVVLLPRLLPSTMETLSFHAVSDFRIAFNILFSTVIYLFDFLTTVLAAKDIFHIEKKQHLLLQNHNLDGIFIVLICFIVVGHIGNGIILFLTLPPEEQPLLQAYFLPLIQLWRLVKLIWLSSTCKRLQCLESDIKPLYNIISVALETSHQLIIQLYVCIFVPPSNKLVLSLIVSFISVAYNGAVAILSVTNKAQNYRAAIAGGTYILSSFILRSLTCAVLNASRRGYFTGFACSLVVGILINFVNMWFVSSDWLSFRWHKALRYFSYGYLAFSVGPLYPMLREEHEQKKKGRQEESGKSRLHLKLCIAMMSHLSMDIILFPLCFIRLQKQPWWGSACGHGIELLKHLKKPYWFIYTGKSFCQVYLPRFVYASVLVILSFLGFLLVDDWWNKRKVQDDTIQCLGQEHEVEMGNWCTEGEGGSESELQVKHGSSRRDNIGAGQLQIKHGDITIDNVQTRGSDGECSELSDVGMLETWKGGQTDENSIIGYELSTIVIVYT